MILYFNIQSRRNLYKMLQCKIFLNSFIFINSFIYVWTQSSDACGGLLGRGHNGIITSPNFPNPYPPNMTCVWEIMGQPESYIFLNFTHFELESVDDCRYDYVEISRKSSMDSEWQDVLKFCGQQPPPDLASTDYALRIVFRTDSSHVRSGFLAQYSTGKKKCPWKEIPCDDSKCIGNRTWCDGIADCEDKSDEKYCQIKTPWNHNINNHCNAEKHFTCKNGMCIPKDSKCDGHMDCYDRSDETHCGNENVDATTDSTESFTDTTLLYTTYADWYGSETESITSLSENPLTHPVSRPEVSTVKSTAGCFGKNGPSQSNSDVGSAVLPPSSSQPGRETSPIPDETLDSMYPLAQQRNYLDISIKFPFGQRWPAPDKHLQIDHKPSQNVGREVFLSKRRPSSAPLDWENDADSADAQDRNVKNPDEELYSGHADVSLKRNDPASKPFMALFLFSNAYPINIRVNDQM